MGTNLYQIILVILILVEGFKSLSIKLKVKLIDMTKNTMLKENEPYKEMVCQ